MTQDVAPCRTRGAREPARRRMTWMDSLSRWSGTASDFWEQVMPNGEWKNCPDIDLDEREAQDFELEMLEELLGNPEDPIWDDDIFD